MELEKELAGFSKHIPQVLRQQLICELVNDYIVKRNGAKLHAEVRIQPSIQRFHGALLFVDISGFTVLSQKLDVESLKNNINNYFKKMLEVVDKWGGDVIKFAGDALYIVWPTNIHTHGNNPAKHNGDQAKKADPLRSHRIHEESEMSPAFQLEVKKALEKAVACGLEICSSCGKHEVFIGESNERQSNQLGILGRLMPNLSSFLSTAKVSPTTTNHTISYLDVHAGVSMGLMAGIDIGFEERWEYFIIGDPIAGVAAAEGSAEKGDVAMCAKSHAILHPPSSKSNSPTIASTRTTQEDEKDIPCACGCFRTPSGCFKVVDSKAEPPKGVKALRRSRSKSKIEEVHLLNELAAQETKLSEAISTDVERAFMSAQPMLKHYYAENYEKYVANPRGKNNKDKKSTTPMSEIEKHFLHSLKEVVHDHFSTWMKSALVVETMFHVHDASRHDFSPQHKSLTGEYFSVLGNIFHATEVPKPADRVTRLSLELKPTESADSWDTLSKTKIKPVPRGQGNNSLSSHDINYAALPGYMTPDRTMTPVPNAVEHKGHEATTASELRSVTIMFIKIDGMDMQLTIDANRSKTTIKPQSICYENFGFLDRTENEAAADQLMLQKLQSCIEVLGEAIYTNGGQMRQFMVDDKGTVCIATFGLRGAVNEDNAAAAIEAGNSIINGLERINIISSIGITTGKAYCGQVGSSLRHEFAVMGPSVNLSARLMCKAGPNSIMCDHDTAIRDRAHEFNKLSAVVAKGYAQPVMTYSPKFNAHPMMQQMMVKDPSGSLSARFIGSLGSSSGGSLRVRMDFKTADRDQAKFTIRSGAKNNDNVPPGERLWKLSDSDFFIPNSGDTFLGESVVEHSYVKLHGRKQEIAKLFAGLFTKKRSGNVFGFEEGVRMVALCGAGGIGKSALAAAFAAKLFHASKRDPQFNAFIMKNRPSSLHSAIPFNTWRPLVGELCRSVYRIVHNQPATPKRVKGQGDYNDTILRGLDEIFNLVPREMVEFKNIVANLLGFADLEESEASNRMDMKMKMLKCCELIAAIISCSAKVMKKMVIIILEDVQSLDAWSFAALHQVWLLGTGMTCVLNYTNASSESQSLASWSKEVYEIEHVPRDVLQKQHDIFGRFDDPRRFKAIDVAPLDRDAVEGLSKEMLGVDISGEEITRIFEASGGNPLYAIELIKTLVSSHGIAAAVNVESKVSTEMNHRVEEIICFRLDKLDSALQTVLKAAAVAASNGKAFDALVISFILQEHDYFAEDSNALPFRGSHAFDEDVYTGNNMTQVENALEELVANGDFIQFVGGDPEDELNYEEDSLGLTTNHHQRRRLSLSPFGGDGDDENHGPRMEFKIPVEQATIYGLIVDEQKEYFHERVALYCIRRLSLASSKGDDDTFLYEEEAFHWEHSSLWSRALSTYLKLGDIRRRENDDRAWLQCIYKAAKMYKFMEEETCAVFPFEENVFREETILINIIQSGGRLPSDVDQHFVEMLDRELDAVYEVFAVDMRVMPLVAKLYVDLVGIQLSTFDDTEQVTFAMGVAFKLYLACNYWPEYRKHHTPDDNSLSSAKVGRVSTLQSIQPSMGLTSKQEQELNASMKTTETENHLLLGACSLVKLLHSTFSNAGQFLSKTMLDTASNHLVLEFMDESQSTILGSVRVLENLQKLDYCSAVKHFKDMLRQRSADGIQYLVRGFNLDISPYLAAMLYQYTVLSGLDGEDRSTSHWYIAQLHDMVRIYKHGPSLVWLVLRLLPCLIYQNAFDEAVFFLDVYTDFARNSNTLETLPIMLLDILRTWVFAMKDLSHRNGIATHHAEESSSPVLPVSHNNPLLVMDHIDSVVLWIENRAKATRLSEESEDGITVQLENFLFNCGCSLEFISLQLTSYQIAMSRDESRHAVVQNGFIKRLDSLQRLIQFQETFGSSLNIMNTLMAFRFALTCNESFPASIVRSSIVDGFTYRLHNFVEMHLKQSMFHTVYFLGDYAANYLPLTSTMSVSVVEKYRLLMTESLRQQAIWQQKVKDQSL